MPKESPVALIPLLLPTERRDITDTELLAMGFGLGECPNKLEQHMTLPLGWSVRQDPGHSSWSYLHDAKGRRRMDVYRKSTPYEQSLTLTALRRFKVDIDHTWMQEDPQRRNRVCVFNHNKPVRRRTGKLSDPKPYEQTRADAWYKENDALKKEAEAWLDQRYPNWKIASAYWD